MAGLGAFIALETLESYSHDPSTGAQIAAVVIGATAAQTPFGAFGLSIGFKGRFGIAGFTGILGSLGIQIAGNEGEIDPESIDMRDVTISGFSSALTFGYGRFHPRIESDLLNESLSGLLTGVEAETIELILSEAGENMFSEGAPNIIGDRVGDEPSNAESSFND